MVKKEKAKKTKAAKQPDIFENIESKHEFNDQDKIQMLADLARLNNEKDALTEQMKASAKGWKGRIEAVQIEINRITNNATSGYEMRPLRARVEFDRKKGKKTYFHPETKKKIETRDMTEADYERLPMDIPDKKPPGPGENIVSVGDAFKEAEQTVEGEDKDDPEAS